MERGDFVRTTQKKLYQRINKALNTQTNNFTADTDRLKYLLDIAKACGSMSFKGAPQEDVDQIEEDVSLYLD